MTRSLSTWLVGLVLVPFADPTLAAQDAPATTSSESAEPHTLRVASGTETPDPGDGPDGNRDDGNDEPGPTPILVDGRTGVSLAFDTMIRRLSRRDVVFLGEDHRNDAFHRIQRDIVQALHQHRPELTVSLEMFERDTQGLLNDYLRGRIDEATFLADSRPWKNYAEHYAPVVQYAREHGLDVLASNVPRHLAAALSRTDDPFEPGPFTSRTMSAPADAYHARFVAIMSGHMGASGADAMERMYRAQCLKDDTMAEAITDHLQQHRHRRPMVVHLNGKFHSDHGHGTAQRVVERMPGASLGLVTMIARDADTPLVLSNPERGRAEFVYLIPPEPENATEPR